VLPQSVYIQRNDVAYQSYYTGCAAGPAANAAWNKVGVDDTVYAGAKLYNLGPVGAFVSRAYAVRKGNLTMCDLTVNDCTDKGKADPPDATVWTPVATDVVGLHAQYGKDPGLDGSVDAWDATTLTGAARAQVIAVRLGLAVRSGQYEKDIVTAGNPVWHQDATGTADAPFDVSGVTDSGHYRYKTAQSIIPVRNMIWGQQNPL
jgi:type IV pilus assembly protein PilW